MPTREARKTKPAIVVAGHACADVIPSFPAGASSPGELFAPGKLQIIGPVRLTAGGAVANTGLALHRLGIPVRLMGKVGADALGLMIRDLFRGLHPRLAKDLRLESGEHTSYTIVLNPPGFDRMFLHYPGTNDTFRAADVPLDRFAPGSIFHFGYPPLMRRMYRDGGRELAALFRRARAHGLAASLDMAHPDPEAEAGRVNWRTILRRTLPHVDLFAPSLDETIFMLDPALWRRLQTRRSPQPGPERLASDMAAQLLDLGARAILLKLGAHGLYLRTTPDARRLNFADPSAWAGREMLVPCFRVRVRGTTGAGDRTLAGFLVAWREGLSPTSSLTLAVAVGASSVEAADPLSDLPSLSQIRARIQAGWPRRSWRPKQPGWRWSALTSTWIGPADGGCRPRSQKRKKETMPC